MSTPSTQRRSVTKRNNRQRGKADASRNKSGLESRRSNDAVRRRTNVRLPNTNIDTVEDSRTGNSTAATPRDAVSGRVRPPSTVAVDKSVVVTAFGNVLPKTIDFAKQNEYLQQFRDALTAYELSRMPKASVDLSARFMKNLAARVATLDEQGAIDFADAANRQLGAALQSQPFESAFNDLLDAVAMFTVASSETLSNLRDRIDEIDQGAEPPATSLGYAWHRRSDSGWRRGDGLDAKAWRLNQSMFNESKRLDGLDFGNKTQFLKNFATASIDDSERPKQFKERLLRLFGGTKMSEALATDLGRIQYLMLNMSVATKYLQVLAQNVNFQLGANSPRNMDGDELRTKALEAEKAILRVVEAREAEHGFRTDQILPDGILEERDFFNLLIAGYMPNDIGAGIEHGSLSHRLQWNVVMQHFEKTEGWFHTPLDIYTQIGKLDMDRHELNNSRFFEFERIPSVWAQLFDQQGGRGNSGGDLSRPDFIREILNRDSGLKSLGNAIETIQEHRRRQGESLRLEYTEYRIGVADLKIKLSNEDSERMKKLYERHAISLGDELYMLDYYQKAQSTRDFKRVHKDNDLPILIEKNSRYRTERDELNIVGQGIKWQDSLVQSDPTNNREDRRDENRNDDDDDV